MPWTARCCGTCWTSRPPALEELAALSVLTDALVQERFKRIVVDPVASSSGVRLLEVPELGADLADAPSWRCW